MCTPCGLRSNYKWSGRPRVNLIRFQRREQELRGVQDYTTAGHFFRHGLVVH